MRVNSHFCAVIYKYDNPTILMKDVAVAVISGVGRMPGLGDGTPVSEIFGAAVVVDNKYDAS